MSNLDPLAQDKSRASLVKPGRSVVWSQHAMAASSQPLASQVGLEVLKRGGNAVDAAIAMAAILNVREPMMTSIGGDAFMLVYWSKNKGAIPDWPSGDGRIQTRCWSYLQQIISMLWSELSAGRSRSVPLTSIAREELLALHKESGWSEYVFVNSKTFQPLTDVKKVG